VAKAKNTGIRTLLEKNIDVGILVDDDVYFYEGWLKTYTKYIEDFQLHHHAWNDRRIFEYLRKAKPDAGALKSFAYLKPKKGYRLFRHPASCGIFLTFTPKLIEKIGYFKVMPGKYGGAHQHFTIRANKTGLMSHPQDLVNSYELIEHIGVLDRNVSYAKQQHAFLKSVSDETLEKESINAGLRNQDVDRYIPCTE